MTRLARYFGLSVQQFAATLIVFGMVAGAEWFQGSRVPKPFQAPVEWISGRTLCPYLTVPRSAFLSAAYSGGSGFVHTGPILERAREIRFVIKSAKRAGLHVDVPENSRWRS
jgi:hypothetical protein